MSTLAIKSHSTRGKEVIEILKMLGGKMRYKGLNGDANLMWYYIDSDNYIDYQIHSNFDNTIVFTLEEFLEKFPYKVGDKVSSKYLKNHKIEKMEWIDTSDKVIYKLQGHGWYSVAELQPYKEETVEEKLMPRIDFTGRSKDKYILDLGNYEIKEENDKTYLVRKKPEYPKTYEECCKVLNLTKYPPALVPNKSMFISQYIDFPHYHEVQVLAELLICRDAYWQIAGAEMGLEKPWEPDWNDRCFIIANNTGYIHTYEYHGSDNCILAFPTAEIRDMFYENFKDLIEACKELL